MLSDRPPRFLGVSKFAVCQLITDDMSADSLNVTCLGVPVVPLVVSVKHVSFGGVVGLVDGVGWGSLANRSGMLNKGASCCSKS